MREFFSDFWMSLVTSLSRECEIFDFNVDIDKIDLLFKLKIKFGSSHLIFFHVMVINLCLF